MIPVTTHLHINEDDERILNKLESAGYGWRTYARNILAQGWISAVQRDTIYNMVNKLNGQSVRATSPRYSRKKRKFGEMYDYGCGDNFEYADYGGTGECF